MYSRDTRIQRETAEHLHWDNRLSTAEIGVRCSDGVVTLQGVVPTCAARIAAEADAGDIPGVQRIQNDTIIQHPIEMYRPDDTELRIHIERQFLWNPHFKSARIAVSCDEGEVTLSGGVDAYWKKIRAEEMLYDIGGVLAVHNDLVVNPARARSDRELEQMVTAAIVRAGAADIDTLTICADRGVVRLEGLVPDWNVMHAIVRIAMHTEGVTDIINATAISPKAEPPPGGPAR
jgi:osmotically-inducible protein OsmY